MIKHRHVLVLNQKAKTLEAKPKVVAQVFVHGGLVHDDISLGSTFADISVSANKEHTTIWFKDNLEHLYKRPSFKHLKIDLRKLQISYFLHIYKAKFSNSPKHWMDVQFWPPGEEIKKR